MMIIKVLSGTFSYVDTRVVLNFHKHKFNIINRSKSYTIFTNAWSKNQFSSDKITLLKFKNQEKSCRWNSNKQTSKKQDIKAILENIPRENIRNFSIVAHIDHGKSTLSDRLLEFTDTISKNIKNEQFLDKLPVERERGITVKAQSVSMLYKYKGEMYLLNLIDTPGHVDFSFEVSRSLAACQGAVLLVDANQGVQAQTVANFNLAFCNDLTIIPVMNKIDLKNADPERVSLQMKKLFEIETDQILKVSAKLGTGIEDLLTAIIERVPHPPGDLTQPFRGLLFDFWFDQFKGVVTMISVVDGSVKIGDKIVASSTGITYEVRDLGIMNPEETPTLELKCGQVGFLSANIRNLSEAKIGDTLHHKDIVVKSLPEVPPAKPMVFAGIYPADQSKLIELRASLSKLTLSDSSVEVSTCASPALGQGWRLGFLGLLHMEVFTQRLDQEFDAQVVITAPNVSYKAKLQESKKLKRKQNEEMIITNPLEFPDRMIVSEYLEPMVLATIITPEKFLGAVTSICAARRGIQKQPENIDNQNVILQVKFPLNEIIVDFFDELKSVTSGFASFDYEEAGYETTDLQKLTILLNDIVVEELTLIVHTSRAQSIGRRVCLRLKETIQPQLYAVAIQATVGSKVVARETLKALRKNVLAKCYGGDVSRKMKLLKRQAEGKKKMRMIGNIEIPRDAFIKVLKK